MRSTKSPQVPQEPPSGWLGIYDGRNCRGHVLSRGRSGTEAFDANDKSLGVFPDQQAAVNAVIAAEVAP
jgi:hypothetical protein